MCGIIGYTGTRDTAPLLLEGLKRLEYRGYDSAGIALTQHENLEIRKTSGKVAALGELLEQTPVSGHTGIAHTRWATHGAPETRNAHPHQCGEVAIVHNGIIENYGSLRGELEAGGAIFHSDTDSEVIAVWLQKAISTRDLTMEDAFAELTDTLQGSFALAALTTRAPETLYVMRHGSPMVLGVSEDGHWVASDTLALAGEAAYGYFLQDGERATLTPQACHIYDYNGEPVTRELSAFHTEAAKHDKGGYPHFMLKEMHEQPDVVRRTLAHYVDTDSGTCRFDNMTLDLASLPGLTIVACGTSFYAAQIASYWLEQLAGIPVRVDIASEFRYRHPVLPEGSAALFISQSGETADTLAAMRYVQEAGHHTIALVNVITSTMAREADSVIQTLAGVEIGVASTKAFTAQLTTLACLALTITRLKSVASEEQHAALLHGLSNVADQMEVVLHDAPAYDQLALALMYARDMLFIGRGTSYPLASEGALKMKEISYIHAEGYAAGELKHGPIALVDDGVPIVVIAPDDGLFDKSSSNLEETAARKGNVVLISSQERIASFKGNMTHSAALPACDSFHAPILYALPLQLLSYYVALHKGADIDQPRNLAKSVTVE